MERRNASDKDLRVLVVERRDLPNTDQKLAIMREMCPDLSQEEADFYRANEITEYVDLSEGMYNDLGLVQIYYKRSDTEIGLQEFDTKACWAVSLYYDQTEIDDFNLNGISAFNINTLN